MTLTLEQQFQINRMNSLLQDLNKEQLLDQFIQLMTSYYDINNSYKALVMQQMFKDLTPTNNVLETPKMVYKYDKTFSFENMLELLKSNNCDYPKEVLFQGTVKLHGTNCGIVLNSDGSYYTQSREKLLTDNSHFGFKSWVDANISFVRHTVFSNIDLLTDSNKPIDTVVVYGEWCGKGINSKTAINSLDFKIFVVFCVKVIYKDCSEESFHGEEIEYIYKPNIQLYNTYKFVVFEVLLELEPNNHHNTEKLNSRLEMVRKGCPVALAFGVKGVGEGVVFHSSDYKINGKPLIFKVTNNTQYPKHLSSKPPSSMSDSVLEKYAKELASSLLFEGEPESKYEQGIRMCKESGNSMTTMLDLPHIIKWLKNDLNTENYNVDLNGIDKNYFYKIYVSLIKEKYISDIKSMSCVIKK